MEAIGNEAGEQDKEEAKELEAREGSPKHNLVVKAKVESAVANSSAKGAILGTKEHEEVLAPIGLEPREQGESPKAIEQRRDSAEIAADDDKEDKEYAENEDLATVSFSHQKGKSPVLAQYMSVVGPKAKSKSKGRVIGLWTWLWGISKGLRHYFASFGGVCISKGRGFEPWTNSWIW
ncbi:hypothetical protein U1Q18_046068 [Sarracenia purpurea var. burkii]